MSEFTDGVEELAFFGLGDTQDPVRVPLGDAVVLPEHYARFRIEPIRFSAENSLNVFQANVLKYILRHDAKNGLEDIRKAIRYLLMYEQFLMGNPNWWKPYEDWERPVWVPKCWEGGPSNVKD